MNRQRLTLREDPTSRELTSRSMTFRAQTIDEEARSVEVTMATDGRVPVMDWDRGMIEEILMADGGQMPTQLPFLSMHDRWSLECVLGSVRAIRRDGNQWVGRAYFTKGDPQADSAWNKVRQGHLTDVSIGYRAVEFTDIPAGQRGTVNGKDYEASPKRGLRVTTRWEARECSLVTIGADKSAKVREQNDLTGRPPGERFYMNPLLRRFLESLGLRADASESDAQAYWRALKGLDRAFADGIEAKTLSESDVNAEIARRSAPPTPPVAPVAPVQPSPDALRQQAVQSERERVAMIRRLAGGNVAAELVARAESEGWDEARTGREFLAHVNSQRSPAVGIAPAGIVRNHERDCTRSTLGLAMAMRAGLSGDARIRSFAQRRGIGNWEQAAEQAHRYDDMAMLDVCREAIRLDGHEVPIGRDEIIRSAVSGGALAYIFTDSVNAGVMMAFEEYPDSTVWCEAVDVADFKTNTAIGYQNKASLAKVARGGKATEASVADEAETYKVSRYGKVFMVDDQDIIDDSFNLLQTMPTEMGVACRRLRPDLVYAIVLDNPAMADTGDVFNSTAITTAGGHANYASSGSDVAGGALAAGALQAAITAMRSQYRLEGKKKIALDIVPQYLVVPPDLQFTAEILLQSAERVVAASSGGTYNPLRGKLQLVVETRIGTIGVIDPDSGTSFTGTATNYFLFGQPGTSCRVAYRRGTGRAPVIRSFTLDRGQWGLGWDVSMDIGAKFTRWQGAYMAKGSS